MIACDLIDERLEAARNMGADVIFNSRHGGLYEEIMKLTDGIGVDAAIDVTGSGEAIRTALRSVRAAGRLVGVGLPNKRVELDLANDLIYREVEFTGISGRKIWETWEDFAKVMNGPYYHLESVMGRHFALEDFEEGFACMERGEPGKVLLYP